MPFGIGSDVTDCDTESTRLTTAAIVARSTFLGRDLIDDASFAISTSPSPWPT
jgi:hypothetical protein